MPNSKQISKLLDEIETKIKTLKVIIENKEETKSLKTDSILTNEPPKKIVEGIFDGQNMVSEDGELYPVPANYASKSKLVEGDRLKLTIATDGTFIFKQIRPIERKKIIGKLYQEGNTFYVKVKNKKYSVLTASITYFKAQPGDQITIIVPKNKSSDWAAVENVIKRKALET